jgi:hypothetical protein
MNDDDVVKSAEKRKIALLAYVGACWTEIPSAATEGTRTPGQTFGDDDHGTHDQPNPRRT